MGASVRPTDDPVLRLQYYKETGQTAQAQQYEQYLRETGQLTTRASDAADPNAALHAEFKRGDLRRRMERLNINDSEAVGSPAGEAAGEVARGIETGINALPLGGRFMAGARALGTGDSRQEATDKQNAEIAQFKQDNPRAGVALPVLSNALAFQSPLGKITQTGRGVGAAIGGGTAGAQRLASSEHEGESLSDRLLGTAEDAGIGAAAGYAAPWLVKNPLTRTALGAGAGAFLAPEGARLEGAGAGALAVASPSTTARLAAKVVPGVARDALQSLVEAMGTRGNVNREMEGIQRVLTPLGQRVGAPSTASADLESTLAAGQAKVRPLYAQAATEGGARDAVQREVADAPNKAASALDRLKTLAGIKALPSPGQSAITQAEAQRGFANHDYTNGPAETLESAAKRDYTTVTPPGEPHIDNGLMQRDFTVERPVQLRAANDMHVRGPADATPGPMHGPQPNPLYRVEQEQELAQTALANPHVQMQMKSLMNDAPALRGQEPDSYPVMVKVFQQMNREKGQLMASGQNSGPYWHELQGGLADTRAALLAKAPTLAQANAVYALEVGTPKEGFAKGFSATTKPGTAKTLLARSPTAVGDWAESGNTPELASARGAAVQQGAQARLGQDIAGRGLERGRRGMLSVPSLAASGPATEQRGLAFGDATPDFNRILGDVRAETAADNPEPGALAKVLTIMSKGKISPSSGTEKSLASPEGKRMLDAITHDPVAYQDVLRRYGKGVSLLDILKSLGSQQGGAAVGRQ